jgi:2-hydroxyacyl-CoA lyase 1
MMPAHQPNEETVMATVNGATLMARCLAQNGVRFMFGIVGFPVQPIARAAQEEGIQFIGMRNEQAASYAAQAASYLTGRPQACLVVSGPGVIHALAGLANAKSNCWPMLLIGGASSIKQNGMGAFQEEQQVTAALPLSKYARGVERVDKIPYYVEQAVRSSIFGRPGPAYLDMPDDIILGEVEEDDVMMKPPVGDPPRTQATPEDVSAALASIKTAERPLVIVGKGMAWSRAEDEVRGFIERTQLPFLASPMGKGVVSDDHPLSVGAARTFALQNADLVFTMGARLNWILHFGLPPRYAPDVRLVQLDIAPEEIGTNVPAEAALIGDGRAIVGQLNAALDASPWQYPPETTWRSGIANKIAENRTTTEAMMADDSVPMNYYRVLKDIRDAIPPGAIIASEGANTMDIGRQVLPNFEARTRLDAGSYGTMGVGLGFAVAAAFVHPDRRIVAVEGDSAFGFSGMEVETACRYNLPITFVIINNNGIGGGPSEIDRSRPLPPNSYTPNAHYEKVIEAFGGKGFYVERPDELKPALESAMNAGVPSIVNIMINPRAGRRPQQFAWHTP